MSDAQARLARFGLWCLNVHREDMGDIDGGSIQDTAVEMGILKEREVNEPCGDHCVCAEVIGDFPTVCLFKAEDVQAYEKEQS